MVLVEFSIIISFVLFAIFERFLFFFFSFFSVFFFSCVVYFYGCLNIAFGVCYENFVVVVVCNDEPNEPKISLIFFHYTHDRWLSLILMITTNIIRNCIQIEFLLVFVIVVFIYISEKNQLFQATVSENKEDSKQKKRNQGNKNKNN